ncbi:hypothetical protein ABZ725_51080 [Streptomyces sp. NPDC006872]|uniref:hypothetical protein n=1 Tax=Streptomyces sp. NPDC006872 TaxID=3155720 RepID=UPI0033C2547C
MQLPLEPGHIAQGDQGFLTKLLVAQRVDVRGGVRIGQQDLAVAPRCETAAGDPPQEPVHPVRPYPDETGQVGGRQTAAGRHQQSEQRDPDRFVVQQPPQLMPGQDAEARGVRPRRERPDDVPGPERVVVWNVVRHGRSGSARDHHSHPSGREPWQQGGNVRPTGSGSLVLVQAVHNQHQRRPRFWHVSAAARHSPDKSSGRLSAAATSR